MYCNVLIFQERKPKPRGGFCPGCPTASELPDPSSTCQSNAPSGQGCHGLPESEGLSSLGGWSQRSAAVGCWVSLCSYLSLDFPIWPEGKTISSRGCTLVEGRNGGEFAWWIIKRYANAIPSSCYCSSSDPGKVLMPADMSVFLYSFLVDILQGLRSE